MDLDKKNANILTTAIERICEQKFKQLAKRNNIYCRKPVLVFDVKNDSKYATISFPDSPDIESTVLYTNRTGRQLKKGDRVYLMYAFGSPSQGWLEDNVPLPTL